MIKETDNADRVVGFIRTILVGGTLLFFQASVVNAQTFLDVPTDHWAFPFIEEFAKRGITSGCGGGNFCPEDAVTRAQMAVFIVRAMQRPVVVDGNDSEIGIFVANSNDGGGTEKIDFLTEEGYYVRDFLMATGELSDGTALFYTAENCVGQPHVQLHTGSVFRASDSAIYYVDKTSAAISEFSVGSISLSGSGCFNNPGLPADYVWPALPNDPAVTGFIDQVYQLPINIDFQ